MDKIRIGIIGLGMGFDRLHLPALKKLKDKFEIVAICDITRKKCEMYQKEFSLEDNAVFTDYEDMLKLDNIQAVLTVVPIEENYEVAKAVILSNKHLIAEKPFTKSIKSAQELINLTKDKDIKVLVAENLRYNEEVNIIKDIIYKKELGDVVYFIDNNIFDFKEDMEKDTFASREWRQYPSFDGGTFLDGAIHDLAKHRYLFGEVNKICAFGEKLDNLDISEFSTINTLMHFENNIIGHYSNFNIGKEVIKPAIGLRIFFTNGEIYLEDKNSGVINVTTKNNKSNKIKYTAGMGYYNEWVNFYEAITMNKEINSTMESEIKDMQLVFDVLESVKKHKI